MKLKIEKDADTLCVVDKDIEAVVENQKYVFNKDDIDAVFMITADLGLLYDNMCLAIRINAETAIYIMSEHPLFKKFLFDELTTIIDIDHDKMMKVTTCTETKIFVMYKRK